MAPTLLLLTVICSSQLIAYSLVIQRSYSYVWLFQAPIGSQAENRIDPSKTGETIGGQNPWFWRCISPILCFFNFRDVGSLSLKLEHTVSQHITERMAEIIAEVMAEVIVLKKKQKEIESSQTYCSPSRTICICMYIYIYIYCCMHMNVYECIWMYMNVYDCIWM